MQDKVEYHPVTAKRWPDMVQLFGERGACGGCWCMYWRLTRSEFSRRKGAQNKRAMKSIIDSGEVPGILAYDGKRPVGWCSVAPRERFGSLARSRVLKPIDDKPVWSIVCLFVEKSYRRQRVSVGLLKAAAAYAGSRGARIVEGYPVQPSQESWPDAFVYTGLPSAFRAAGFKEVLRRSKSRPIMRKAVRGPRGKKG
jgi:GNAT superfamily N-acetyltransferase